MKNKTLQEVADELVNFSGKVKGEVFRNHAEYIKYKEGDEGLKKVEDKMASLGAPVKLMEMNSMTWYSEGLSSLVIIVAKEVFNWTEEDIFEWGRFRTKVSFIMKTMTRMFLSIETMARKEIPKHWKRNFNFGSIEAVEASDKKRRLVIRVHGFKTHPLICKFHAGYFMGVAELCVKSKNIKIEELKCMHRGDKYHEYLITW